LHFALNGKCFANKCEKAHLTFMVASRKITEAFRRKRKSCYKCATSCKDTSCKYITDRMIKTKEFCETELTSSKGCSNPKSCPYIHDLPRHMNFDFCPQYLQGQCFLHNSYKSHRTWKSERTCYKPHYTICMAKMGISCEIQNLARFCQICCKNKKDDGTILNTGDIKDRRHSRGDSTDLEKEEKISIRDPFSEQPSVSVVQSTNDGQMDEHQARKRKICGFFKRGLCKFGSDCNRIHNAPDLRNTKLARLEMKTNVPDLRDRILSNRAGQALDYKTANSEETCEESEK